MNGRKGYKMYCKYLDGTVCWFTILDDDGNSLGEVLARSEDDAIDMYLDDHPDCPDAGYLVAMSNLD